MYTLACKATFLYLPGDPAVIGIFGYFNLVGTIFWAPQGKLVLFFLKHVFKRAKLFTKVKVCVTFRHSIALIICINNHQRKVLISMYNKKMWASWRASTHTHTCLILPDSFLCLHSTPEWWLCHRVHNLRFLSDFFFCPIHHCAFLPSHCLNSFWLTRVLFDALLNISKAAAPGYQQHRHYSQVTFADGLASRRVEGKR